MGEGRGVEQSEVKETGRDGLVGLRAAYHSQGSLSHSKLPGRMKTELRFREITPILRMGQWMKAVRTKPTNGWWP